MGVIGSKFDLDESIHSEKGEKNPKPLIKASPFSCEPISTPTPWSLLDPRSPSSNISRTPLEVVLASRIQKIDKIETEIGGGKVVLSLDPRSPTVEFTRTPIIVEAKLRPNNQRKSLIPPPRIIVPPKLLESSPITRNPLPTIKRRSMVGVLETNVDFTETDLDNVNIHLNKTLPDRVTDECVTPLSNKIRSQTERLNEVAPSLDFQPEDTVTVTEPKEVPEVNVTAHVDDFAKKLTNLIYEDDDDGSDATKSAAVNLKLVKTNGNESRTPLGDRNLNGGMRKSISKLKVSDKPRKVDRISRIPVVVKQRLNKGQINCENTPPLPSMYNNSEKKGLRPKKTHWDGDKTLTI